ncbi:tRNA (guanosine(46)-N7)-methyltransferase TrmB [Gammaproteobacteria bacterium]|jgi:tRNA (guanine-N7-)-methyltransferase|nr:tRNA (guanosine(46)-N7)-methyltransferase TrmB [Gammaproteobacteria bacterium]
MENENHMRTIKSYVVRGGRLTHSQQKALDNLWPRFGLNRQLGLFKLQEIFANKHPVVFEIGFGMGDSLAQMAKENPNLNFIGVDVHPPGIGTLLRLIDEEDLTNIRVVQDDAKLVLQESIADNSLERVQIFFPDPWHKKRHHKRRLIQAEFIQSLLPKVKTGGEIHLATDWENYAEQMMEVLSAEKKIENIFGLEKFATKSDRPVTKFQRRGVRLGHGVWDLVFKKL